MSAPTRLLVAVPLAAAATLSVLVLTRREAPDAPPAPTVSSDPFKEVRSVRVMAELAADKPLRLAVAGSFDDLEPGDRVKMFFSSHGLYTGQLSQDAVETVIGRGRAEVLEHRLAPPALERLRTVLAEFDEALRDVSLLIDEEEHTVKEELQRRSGGHVRILTTPRENDPAYPELLAARARVSRGRGAVWGMPARPGEVHVVVQWDEWPALKTMIDDRIQMLRDRQLRVRRWIHDEYEAQGMAVFQAMPARPLAATSPAIGDHK